MSQSLSLLHQPSPHCRDCASSMQAFYSDSKGFPQSSSCGETIIWPLNFIRNSICEWTSRLYNTMFSSPKGAYVSSLMLTNTANTTYSINCSTLQEPKLHEKATVISWKTIQDRSHEPDFKVGLHPAGADCSQAEELPTAYMRSHTKAPLYGGWLFSLPWVQALHSGVTSYTFLLLLSCSYNASQKKRAELLSQSSPEGFRCQNTPSSYLGTVRPLHTESFIGLPCELLNASPHCSCEPVRRGRQSHTTYTEKLPGCDESEHLTLTSHLTQKAPACKLLTHSNSNRQCWGKNFTKGRASHKQA